MDCSFYLFRGKVRFYFSKKVELEKTGFDDLIYLFIEIK